MHNPPKGELPPRGPTWLPSVLRRITELASARRVEFTPKALYELSTLELGLDPEDARDVLANLGVEDFSERVASNVSDHWMYVFKPTVIGTTIYIKVVLRTRCVVVSFHFDEENGDEASP